MAIQVKLETFTSRTFTLSDGINIFFTDSGAPRNSTDYTTVLVLHGSAFNGHGFEKLHDYAHEYNIRTIVWNRRDYPGSTRYTNEELAELQQGKRVFIDRLGFQVADFIKQLIEKEKIPKATLDRKAGGVAIMGWSMGTATAMALFSDPSIISPEVHDHLKEYVKDLILDVLITHARKIDSPHLCFAYEIPEGEKIYDPWTDPNCTTPEELYQNFGFWVSSFYDHPDPLSGKLSDMDIRTRTNEATLIKWTPEELSKYYTQDAAVRSELRMYVPPMQDTLRDITQRSFYDERFIDSYFPDVKVSLIVGTRTNWQCLWGPVETMRRHDMVVAEGGKVRPMWLYWIEGGNHFAHWEMPDALMEKIAAGTMAR
ncbi:hypothetical protein VNI00_011082 [Paramarasmius palmivorus]|uniref:AB hydrolase-1 domain-containing protein n=1 Tax=Paramarasmius palmivorus TaxID=297713 RepID=A0AAW0CF31_9AGAR